MKKSTLILLIEAELLLPGCVSRKIAGINPTGPSAKLVDSGWKTSWSPNRVELRVTKYIKRPAVVKTDSTATISPISSPDQSYIVLDGGSTSGRAATLDTNLPTTGKPSSGI
jgi:hypothetical protein